LCAPLPAAHSLNHVSRRRLWAAAASSPTASCFDLAAHDRAIGAALAAPPRSADISPQAPRSATSPSENRCPCTAGHSRQRVHSERALLSLCWHHSLAIYALSLGVHALAVALCVFSAARCLPHGDEKHVRPVQSAAMEPHCAAGRPVRPPFCCTGGDPPP
jgi:hypothetical protein